MPRMNPTFSEESFRIIRKQALRAGMSPAAYVRDAATMRAGWDEAMAQFSERVSAVEGRQDASDRETAKLRREVATLRAMVEGRRDEEIHGS